MFVAKKKREENISEYILYMFQVEDIIRALGTDDNAIEQYVTRNYKNSPKEIEEITEWYLSLKDDMVRTGAMSSGHLPMIEELLHRLQFAHQQLLKMPVQSIYSALYYKTLPSIIQLRGLSGNSTTSSEIETCFVGIYGYITLKMKGETISEETLSAIKQISTFLAMLADRFCEIEVGKIKIDESLEC